MIDMGGEGGKLAAGVDIHPHVQITVGDELQFIVDAVDGFDDVAVKECGEGEDGADKDEHEDQTEFQKF